MATCTINCDTQDAIIRYTTNGNDPTESDTVYSIPFTVEAGMTVKAKAWKDGMNPSAVASGEAPDELQPTSVPLGSVLSDGSIVIYDRGSTYGDYNLASGVLTRISEGVDDESASSDKWRFLIADSADMEGNNGGVGENKPWGASVTELGVTPADGLGLGLQNTNDIIEKIGSNQDYLWYQVTQKRQSTEYDWFVPTKSEADHLYSAKESSQIEISDSSYWLSQVNGNNISIIDMSTGSNGVSSPTSTDYRVRLLRRY